MELYTLTFTKQFKVSTNSAAKTLLLLDKQRKVLEDPFFLFLLQIHFPLQLIKQLIQNH